jgi:hypothetical protein
MNSLVKAMMNAFVITAIRPATRASSTPVLRIRDVYLESRVRIFSIPDPGSASKNLSILIQKILSSRKYDPGCSSRIPDPGVKKAQDPGSRIRIRNTDHHVTSSLPAKHTEFSKRERGRESTVKRCSLCSNK